MALTVRRTIFHQLLALITILFQIVAGLPGGSGGVLEIIDVVSPTFNDTIWACSGIEHCADYCATTSWTDGLMAGIWDPDNDNSTCECWYIGDLNYYDLPVATPGVTFLDFFEAWGPSGRPSKAQNWGVFTCPEGAQSGPVDHGGFYCGPLTIEPAQPALANLGITGGCGGWCSPYPGFQWALPDCSCYGDLAGLKVTLNYSSTVYVLDYYDFEPHPTTSSTSVTTKTSTKATSHSTSSSATKSTSKSSSHTTPKPTTKSTSRLTSTTKKTSSTKTSSRTTSSKSTLTSTSTSKISSMKTSSKATSSKSTSYTSTSTSKISSSKSTGHSTIKSA